MSSLNPLKAIEGLIVEHGSSVVQGKHIALLKEQLAILKEQILQREKETAILRAENAEFKSRIESLESENSDLKKEIAKLHENTDLSDNALKILNSLFNHGPCGDTERFRDEMGIQESEVEFYFDELKRSEFVSKRPVQMGLMGIVPVTACINENGRNEVMRRRSK